MHFTQINKVYELILYLFILDFQASDNVPRKFFALVSQANWGTFGLILFDCFHLHADIDHKLIF